jgi:hypothetical protein
VVSSSSQGEEALKHPAISGRGFLGIMATCTRAASLRQCCRVSLSVGQGLNSAARTHNPEVAGSNPAPATSEVFTFLWRHCSRLDVDLIVVPGSDTPGGCRAAVAAVSCAFRCHLVTCGVLAAGSWRAAAAGAVSSCWRGAGGVADLPRTFRTTDL